MRTPRANELAEDEAHTAALLADMTGHTVAEIIHRISRSREDWLKFRMTVSLATEPVDYLDGKTGQWVNDPEKQRRQVRSYAGTLFDPD